MRKSLVGLSLSVLCITFVACNDKKEDSDETTFTKADSVTDHYLAYQDSLLETWNIMINDDNQKIKSMHNLVHELLVTSRDDHDQLDKFEGQLEQLTRLRYTQKSMGNADVVEEYDFASTTLVRELITLAESKKEFGYNSTMQKLVEDIRLADERVNNYREEYDGIVVKYNHFLEINKAYLMEINSDTLQKKSMFEMVSAE